MGTLSELLERQQRALVSAADCARLLESHVSALAVHRAAVPAGHTGDPVEVHDPARAHELLDAAVALARGQIRLIQPSVIARHLVIDRLGGDWRERGSRVSVRTIHQSGLLQNATAVSHLEKLSRRGVQIRVAPLLPFRLVVVDDEMALVCLPDSTLLVRQPALLQVLIRIFEYCWDDARDLRTGAADDEGPCLEDRPAGTGAPVSLTEQQLVILRLWAKGRQDLEIARELHVSPRTLRRTVSSLLRRLGVSSRFEAGVIAARTHQLLPDPDPLPPHS
ncbi:helix-turn-helix transcriptional regulator [Kitasatospora albolonga]|uniref:helix-turn-helix transcriptional regulator n=1 Tax=Kitasatospora albolonga TaxID=68173 RepID=UPI0031EEA248